MANFCNYSILCLPGLLLRYCLSDFEMVPVNPIIGNPYAIYYLHNLTEGFSFFDTVQVQCKCCNSLGLIPYMHL